MNRNDIASGLYQHSAALSAISTHSHHMPDQSHKGLGLDALLTNSYVSWIGGPLPQTGIERADFIKRVSHNSYFHYLEQALRSLYSIDKKLDENTWDLFDEAIIHAHRDQNHHLNLLKESCKYVRIINDSYWDPGSDQGHPDIFAPTYRVNMFFYGYSATAQDHNGNNPFRVCGWDPGISFDEYLDHLDKIVGQMKKKGCVALKSALAYDRGLDFVGTQKSAARKGYMNDQALPEDIKAFQDYLYFEVCRLSAKHGMPFQNHTGLGLLEKTNANRLRKAIAANQATTFCLMHGSYPWTGDVAGLVHNYTNVYADLCWLPLISPSVCKRLIKELVEVGRADTMMWGCDTLSGEESYGALLAMREVLSEAFADLVIEGYLDVGEAENLMTYVLYENPKKIFRLTGC